jgi:hypothetical protein
LCFLEALTRRIQLNILLKIFFVSISMLLSYIYRFKSFAHCCSVIVVDPSSSKFIPSILLLFAEQVFWQFFSLIVYFTAFLTLVWMYVRQNAFTEMSHMISRSVYSKTIGCTNSSMWNAAGNKECVLKHCLLKFFVLVHCDSNTIYCVLFYYFVMSIFW